MNDTSDFVAMYLKTTARSIVYMIANPLPTAINTSHNHNINYCEHIFTCGILIHKYHVCFINKFY